MHKFSIVIQGISSKNTLYLLFRNIDFDYENIDFDYDTRKTPF